MTPGYQFTQYARAKKRDLVRLISSAEQGDETEREFLAPEDGSIGRIWRMEGPREWTPRKADGFVGIIPIIMGQSFWISVNSREVFSRTIMLPAGMMGFLPDVCPFREELTRRWFEEFAIK